MRGECPFALRLGASRGLHTGTGRRGAETGGRQAGQPEMRGTPALWLRLVGMGVAMEEETHPEGHGIESLYEFWKEKQRGL